MTPRIPNEAEAEEQDNGLVHPDFATKSHSYKCILFDKLAWI